MSSSMPRTTPACTRSWASWRGASNGPVAYTSAPSAVTPIGAGRLRRRLAPFDERHQILADAYDIRSHRHVAAPHTDADRPVRIDDQRRRPGDQRDDDPSLGEVAATGGVHEEAAVECCHQRYRLRRLDRRRVEVRPTARTLRAGVEQRR